MLSFIGSKLDRKSLHQAGPCRTSCFSQKLVNNCAIELNCSQTQLLTNHLIRESGHILYSHNLNLSPASPCNSQKITNQRLWTHANAACQHTCVCVFVSQVFFLQFPTALLCGEIRKAYVEFCNVSGVALCGLRVVSTHPDFFTFGSRATTPLTPLSPTSAENSSAYRILATPSQPGSVASEVLVSAEDFRQPSGVMVIPIDGSTLQPGESTQLPLWLRGPDQEGVHEINFLFYYESTEKGNKIR